MQKTDTKPWPWPWLLDVQMALYTTDTVKHSQSGSSSHAYSINLSYNRTVFDSHKDCVRNVFIVSGLHLVYFRGQGQHHLHHLLHTTTTINNPASLSPRMTSLKENQERVSKCQNSATYSMGGGVLYTSGGILMVRRSSKGRVFSLHGKAFLIRGGVIF